MCCLCLISISLCEKLLKILVNEYIVAFFYNIAFLLLYSLYFIMKNYSQLCSFCDLCHKSAKPLEKKKKISISKFYFQKSLWKLKYLFFSITGCVLLRNSVLQKR